MFMIQNASTVYIKGSFWRSQVAQAPSWAKPVRSMALFHPPGRIWTAPQQGRKWEEEKESGGGGVNVVSASYWFISDELNLKSILKGDYQFSII